MKLMHLHPDLCISLVLALASGGAIARSNATSQAIDGNVSLRDVSHKLEFVRELGEPADGLAGAAWFDYDNDGFLDLFIPNVAGLPNALFRNNRDGSFTDVAAFAGVANGTGNTGAVSGDLDNDGWADLILTYAGSDPSHQHAKVYRNRGDGTFADITEASGLSGERSSFSPALADIDNDGFLDVFLSSIGTAPGLPASRQFKNTLYRNNGDLTFRNVSMDSGVDTAFGACTAVFSHYDGDAFIDLLVGNCNDVREMPTPLELFRNNSDLTFTDVRRTAGLGASGYWEGLTLADYDNDGDLDLFASNFAAGPFRHALYENQNDGTYRNRAAEAGLAGLELGWGTSFADFDSDGFQDLFLAGSLPIAGFDVIGEGRGNPGYLLMNNRDKTFRKEATFGLAGKFTSGLAVADYDNNGFPDVVIVTSKFPEAPPRFHPDGRPVLLENSGNTNHWLTIRTVGTRSNRDGIGARVIATTGELRQLKEVRAGSSMASMDSPWLTFGLGQHDAVGIEVRWPSGLSEHFAVAAVDRLLVLTEGTGEASPSGGNARLSIERSSDGLWLEMPESDEDIVVETAETLSGPWRVFEAEPENAAPGRVKLDAQRPQAFFRGRYRE